jgi:acetolactate synthase-like protein
VYYQQIEFFGDDVATLLEFTDYQNVATSYGGDKAVGILVREINELKPALLQAKEACRQGKCVLVNVLIGKTEFRKGSISV